MLTGMTVKSSTNQRKMTDNASHGQHTEIREGQLGALLQHEGDAFKLKKQLT